MSKLYLYNYNNYFNRIIKRESTLANYGTPLYTLAETNFNYNDGVTTSHVVNYDSEQGDYVIITDKNNNIVSRWFVVENKRQRTGQHTLSLKRDLIADNYDKLIKAPMLVNRAMINDPDNPLIFNTEGFSFNQIKIAESLLKDATNSAWYALYFSKNTPSKSGSFSTGSATYDTVIATDIDASIYNPGTYTYIVPENVDFRGIASAGDVFVNFFKHLLLYPNGYQRNVSPIVSSDLVTKYTRFSENLETVKSHLYTAFTGQYTQLCNKIKLYGDLTDAVKTELDKIGNQGSIYVKDASDDIYKVTLNVTSEYKEFVYQTTGDYVTAMQTILNNSGLTKVGDWGTQSFGYSATVYTYNITAELQAADTISWTLFEAGKQPTNDADYNIVLIPYNDVTAYYSKDDDYIPNSIYAENSRKLVNSIIKEYGSTSYLYDVQLLPYFPYQNIVRPKTPGTIGSRIYAEINEELDATVGLPAAQYYHNPESEDENIILFYIDKSSYSIDINYTLLMRNYVDDPVLNKKLNNECRITRLCSPNYNGIFEFSIAKNNGVESFNVDVTMRPYNPYIHVNPNFKNLYGNDFNDARGLICQGDFSLPIVTDAFKQYEYQNKNYLNVFNRQIEHLDFEYQKAQQQAFFGAFAGTIQGGLSGAALGSLKGGPAGAIAGGATGAIASLAGGIADYEILKQRQAENKDLTIDMFNYQLGNIKALSYSINKVTPLTYNNKIWPFIETYSSTDTEVEILKNKIKYTSMNIQAIGTIEDYLQTERTYISGSLIRLESFNMPTHELNEVYNELTKGVFI